MSTHLEPGQDEKVPEALHVAVIPPVRGNVCADPAWMVRFARTAEELGYESLVMVEHPLVIGDPTTRYPYSASGRMPLADDCDVPDPLDVLAYVAAATSKLGLATGVLVLPAHHPVVLAKRAATLDRLSGGRLRLCIGLGWMREEIEACGTAFESRGRRCDESIDVMRTLWAESGPSGVSFSGEFFSFERAHSYPKPLHPGGIPIHIGGHSAASVRRAARRGDGWQPLGLTGDELAGAIGLLREETERQGRDREAVEVTLGGLLGAFSAQDLDAAARSGARRVVLSCIEADIQAACDQLAVTAAQLDLARKGR